MQLPNGPADEKFPTIEAALQEERILRYMKAAGGDKMAAFKFYLWNCVLCEAFYISLHFSEVVCRNAMHQALLERGDPKWFENSTFHKILEDQFRFELEGAIRKETKQHGNAVTSNHIVSALTFGFWDHLATKRFERYLWAKGIHHAFPCAPKGKTYEDLHQLIESVRRWRNRIAHHQAIFDKGPSRKHQDALELIKWSCGDTAVWVAATSRVQVALSLRPKGV